VTAAEARPGSDTTETTARGITALLETPDGARTDLAAASSRLDEVARLLHLGGGVVINTSTGYRIETPGIAVSLDRTGMDSEGAVAATGPLGTLTADALHIGQTGADYVVVFNGRVKLVYLPRSDE